MMKLTDTVKHLLIINVVFFIGALSIGQNGDFFRDLFAMHFPSNDLFKPWQVITHMFMHATYVNTSDGMTIYFQHILFNMFSLWMFGVAVEQYLGSKKFLFLYISAGLGALLFQLGYNYFEFNNALNQIIEAGFSKSEILDALATGRNLLNTTLVDKVPVDIINSVQLPFHSTMVGASGCIMGILAAFGVMNPNAELMLIFLPIPIKAKFFIPGIILLDVISAITGQSFFSPSNTAYMAHVGGAVVGFIIMWYWKKNSFNQNRWD